MAPLLGRKPYPLVKPLAEPPGPEETIYTIEHTEEAFRNKEEYEARLQRYGERIWTCKSTGSNQLTHKEAWEEEQEVTELLKEEYPPWFEKPVLEMVHHNTISLDKLVDQAWVEILTKYAVDEECDFLVGKDKTLRVRVVKAHPLEKPEEDAAEKKLNGACDSPSSDKENAAQENQRKQALPKEEESRRDSLCDRARRSPRKLPTNFKEEKKRWVMPKFLPHKYDVKLINEDKVISDVPADSLFRTERPPNKEIMRYFIRHNAMRLGTGESAPWVVEDELVKKYNLPSKFSDFLLDPHKYFAENLSGKRKSLTSPDGRPAKKPKTTAAEGSAPDEMAGKEKKKRKKKVPVNMPLSPSMWGSMQVKMMNGSPLKVKNSGTPQSPCASGDQNDSDDDVILMSPGFPKAIKPAKKPGDRKRAEAKKNRKSANATSPTGTKGLNGQKASKKEGKDGKGPKMKQMTLLDMAKRRSTASPKKRAKSAGPGPGLKLGKPLPPMALHLLRYYKENKGKEDKKSALSSLISKAAKVLTAEDRARLPEEVREVVQKRWELLEQKRQWAAMSEEERQEVMRRKREEIKEKLREKAKERREKEMQARKELQRRFEDQELEGRNLPAFKLVDTPEGVPNALFGDVAMLVDFLNCYAGLLMPDDQYPVTATALMEALAAEKGGFLYLSRVLVVLLQTLLQDELAEGYSELDMPLSEIPLTMHSVSELVRLCLRPLDAQGEGGSSEACSLVGDPDSAPSTATVERLETAELFELTPEEKAGLLVALCHRILMTYSVEDHVDAVQQRSAELWKERLATLKEANDRRRAEKQRRKEQMGAKGAAWVKVEGSNGSTLATPVSSSGKADKKKEKEGGGKKDAGKAKPEPKPEPKAEPEPEDMISTVKSRRLQSIQAKKEKEEQERQNKERMEKEAEEERVRKQKASAERAFQTGIKKAKLVLRRVPLGTDRNHNRYWLFSDVVPGLYVEKGWVHDSIDYSYSLPPEEVKEEEEDEAPAEAEKEEVCDAESGLNDDGQQGVLAVPETPIETTIPKRGQNLWFVCDTSRELEELMESLHPQGVRESVLKTKLQYRYQDILHSIHLARKPNLGLKTCDGHQELLKYLRSDIIEVSSRLQKGGLGYMDGTAEFEERVRSLESLKDFGECVITLQESVIQKFLQGFMAPKQKKKKPSGEESGKAEEVDEEKRLAAEAKVATAVEKWKSAIREAQTFSRMHVLLGMLDACIKWDMSAENARCKVCRKKGEDDKLILCDECNKAFHLFCLRPALYSIPEGEWLCPACQPAVARRCTRGRNYNEDSEEEEGSEEEEASEEEDEEEDEEDDENNDDLGHYLRSRKPNKGKRSSSRAKPAAKAPNKKSPSSRPGRPKGSPASPLDSDEPPSSKRRVSRQEQDLGKCEEILNKLIKFRYSWPFREPVSVDEAEDYLDIISNPMDFQTMQRKFTEGQYRHSSDFLEDVKLIFSNAEEYNQPGSAVLSYMAKTEQHFVEVLHRLAPGLGYLRRRARKWAEPETRPQNGKRKSTPKREEDEEEEEGGRRQRARSGRPKYKESEDEEEDEGGHPRRTSSRTAGAGSASRGYREQESDSECEEAEGRRAGRGRPRYSVADGDFSDEDGAGPRHSKRQRLSR